MPFGLTNAPSTFQSLMNDIFRKFLRKFVLVFFEDILICSSTLTAHLNHLQSVFDALCSHQLVANVKKCAFGQNKIDYLSHVIDSQGVSTDPSKIQAIIDWPTPVTLRTLRGFLVLTGYYKKFVRNYSSLAWPLTQQLKKDAFHWNSEVEDAFQKLKDIMISLPVLALPDFSQEFVIETDASSLGLGAILMQHDRPIAFYIQKLSTVSRTKSVYERELMEIVFAVKKWRPYILGKHFTIHTDMRSLHFLLEQCEVEAGYQKWLLKLMPSNFSIQCKPGKTNSAADSLSRVSGDAILSYFTVPILQDFEELKELVAADPFLANISTAIQQDPTTHPTFSPVAGQLYYKGKLAIPAGSPYVEALLREFHNSVVDGHAGIRCTYSRLFAEFYWQA